MKISKEIEDLNNIINYVSIEHTPIKNRIYTLFKGTWNILYDREHIGP